MSKKEDSNEDSYVQQTGTKSSNLDQLIALMKPMQDVYRSEGIVKALQESPEILPKPEVPSLTDPQELKILLKTWFNAFGPKVFWQALDHYKITIPEDTSAVEAKNERIVQLSTIAFMEISGSHDKLVSMPKKGSQDASAPWEHWRINMNEDGSIRLYFIGSKVSENYITINLKKGDTIIKQGPKSEQVADGTLTIMSSHMMSKEMENIFTR
jgi:hypothetical protein